MGQKIGMDNYANVEDMPGPVESLKHSPGHLHTYFCVDLQLPVQGTPYQSTSHKLEYSTSSRHDRSLRCYHPAAERNNSGTSLLDIQGSFSSSQRRMTLVRRLGIDPYLHLDPPT